MKLFGLFCFLFFVFFYLEFVFDVEAFEEFFVSVSDCYFGDSCDVGDFSLCFLFIVD